MHTRPLATYIYIVVCSAALRGKILKGSKKTKHKQTVIHSTQWGYIAQSLFTVMKIRILTTLSFYLAPLTAKLKNSSRSFLERLASFLSSPLLSRQVLLRVSRQTGPYTCSTTVRLDESPPDFDY